MKKIIWTFIVLTVLLAGSWFGLSQFTISQVSCVDQHGQTCPSELVAPAIEQLQGKSLFFTDVRSIVHAASPLIHLNDTSKTFPNAVQLVISRELSTFSLQGPDQRSYQIFPDGRVEETSQPSPLLLPISAEVEQYLLKRDVRVSVAMRSGISLLFALEDKDGIVISELAWVEPELISLKEGHHPYRFYIHPETAYQDVQQFQYLIAHADKLEILAEAEVIDLRFKNPVIKTIFSGLPDTATDSAVQESEEEVEISSESASTEP